MGHGPRRARQRSEQCLPEFDESGLGGVTFRLEGESLIPIPGTKHAAHVEENARAAALDVSDDDLRRAGALINADTVSGDRDAAAQRISLDPE